MPPAAASEQRSYRRLFLTDDPQRGGAGYSSLPQRSSLKESQSHITSRTKTIIYRRKTYTITGDPCGKSQQAEIFPKQGSLSFQVILHENNL
jgi:hypothetical protein